MKAYELVNERNFDTVRSIFIKAVEHDVPKEKVIEELVQKAGFDPKNASALYEEELGVLGSRPK